MTRSPVLQHYFSGIFQRTNGVFFSQHFSISQFSAKRIGLACILFIRSCINGVRTYAPRPLCNFALYATWTIFSACFMKQRGTCIYTYKHAHYWFSKRRQPEFIYMLRTHAFIHCLCWNLTCADIYSEILWEENIILWLKSSSSDPGVIWKINNVHASS
jgi:hypothetical protein